MASHQDRERPVTGRPLTVPAPLASPTGPPMAGLDLQIDRQVLHISSLVGLFHTR